MASTKATLRKGLRWLVRAMLVFSAVARADLYSSPYYYTTNNEKVTITGYNGPGGTLSITNAISGLPVTRIGDGAFSNCASLVRVTIPNSVSSIGVSAFRTCTNLTSVIIPNSVTGIESNAFFRCTSLTDVTIPDNVTSIGAWVFYQCVRLTSVTIPDGVPYIGHAMFDECYRLSSVAIGNSVSNIGPFSFYLCTSLTNVTIPKSVTSIGDGAFNFDRGLKGLYFLGNAPTLLSSSVFLLDTNATVYYLPGTTNWTNPWGNLPTVLWNPQVQPDANFGVGTNGFGFTFTNAGSPTIVVQACTNLLSPGWFDVQTNTLAGGSSYFSDPGWTNDPARFYRFRVP
jgi:hypothetical protein